MLPLLFFIILPQLSSCGILSGILPNKNNNCGLNEVYRLYGHKCPLSCDTLKEKVCCNDVTYVPGCFCVDGFILETREGPRKCVPIFDCPRPGVLRFKTESISFPENVGVARIPVLRVNGSKGEVTVRWKVDDSSKAGILTFPEGVNLQFIEIPISDDYVWNPDTTFQVKLFDPSYKAEVSPEFDHILVTIVDDDMKPGYLEMEKTDITVKESTGKANVNVVRLGGKDGQISIRFKTVPGTARERSDFIPTTGELVFEEGETIKTIYVTIVDDDVREGPETFQVRLFDPQAGRGVRNFKPLGTKMTTTVLITDDDMKPGYLELERGSISVPESAGKARIKVLRQQGSDGQLRVKYKTVGTTASSNLDFGPTEGELVFDDGETNKFIDVPIIDDGEREKPEGFRVELYDPSTGADVINFRDRGSIHSVDITIIDNDMKPGSLEFEKATFSTPEGSGSVTICVVRVEGTDGEIRVRFKTVSRTALAGQDFKARAGLLVFREGESRKCIVIQLVNDDVREPKEIFEIVLESPTAAPDVINFRGLGGRRVTAITITDDDMQPGALELEQSSYTIPENVGSIRVGVVRTGGSDGTIRVLYKTDPKTALAGQDFKPTTGELVFREGEKIKYITVQITNDRVREPTESFDVVLYDSNAAPDVINFRGLGRRRSATISITDDDMTPGTFELEKPSYSVRENAGRLQIGVQRVGGSDGEVFVLYKTVPNTALSGQDFLPVSGQLDFKDGETLKYITVQINDDDLREPTKSFDLELYDPTAAPGVINFRGLGRRKRSTISITDDDMQPGALELERSSYTIPENVGSIRVGVVRTGGSDGTIRVLYKTDPKTALAGQDFKPTTGELIFKEGEKIKYITVQITNDRVREPTEIFDVILYDSNAAPNVINFRGLGARRSATISITDDDMNPGTFELERPSYSVQENAGRLQIGVQRVGGSDGEVFVLYKTVPNTALSGQDFLPVTGQLDFKDGETLKYITVQINDDDIREPTKSFDVELYDSTAAPGVINFRGLGRRKRSTISITDDDMKPGFLELERPSYTVPENAGTVQVAVVRVDGAEGEIRVHYKTVQKTAHAGQDFAPVSGLLVFKEGETLKYISVKITDDDVREPAESFDLILHDTTAGPGVINFRGLGPKTVTTITVTDDDMRPGYLEVQQTSIFVPEDVGRVKVCVLRLDGSDGEIRVSYKTVPLSAAEEQDFQPSRGSLLFKEQETKKCFYVRIINDNLREPAEVFEVVLSESSAGPGVINFRGLGARKRMTISITDDDMTPGELHFGESPYITPENIGTVKIKVERSGGSDGQVQVRYKTIGKTARPSLDFVDASGILVFSRGETIKFIEVTIIDDKAREPTESFEVQLFDPTPGEGVINFNGLGEKVTATVTITDDDMSPGYFELEKPSYSVRENDGTLKIGVVRLDGSDGQVRVHYKTVPLTALDEVDFDPISGELVFEDGEKLKYFDVRIRNDDLWEPTKNFKVELFDSLAGPNVINFRGIGQRKFSTITIDDDDMKPGFLELGRPSYSIPENSRSVRIEVVRVDGSDGEVRVRLKTVSKTATAGLDFQPVDVQLVFKNRETQKFVEIPIVDDDVREPTELFEVQLYDPSPSPGTINFRGLGRRFITSVTIDDNDVHPGVLDFENTNIAVPEDVGVVQVTIIRTGGEDGKLVAKYRTIDGTARTGTDYTPVEGIIEFQEGEIRRTLTIRIVDDNMKEPLENFQVQIFTDDPRTRRFTTITVIDNDVNPGTFEFRERAVSVIEGGRQVVLTVQRTGGSDGRSSVTWRTIDGTAFEGFDYRGRQGTLTFNDGETEKSLSIEVIDDHVRERDEQFMVGLFDPTRGAVGLNSMVTVTIRDDDEEVPSNPVVSSNSIQIYFTELIVRVAKGVNTVRFHIEKSGDSRRPINVLLQTLDGSAKGGEDYKKIKGRITFERNDIKLTVEIKLIESRKQEFGKYFLVKLSNPSEGLVVPTHNILTVILDEDALRSDVGTEVKTISESDFDFDVSGRKSGSFSETSSSSVSGSSASSTSSRCNNCRPGTKGGFGNIPNPIIPSTGTNLGLSGTRTSNTGSTGVGGVRTSSTNMNFSVTGMKMPTINTPGASNVPNVKIPNPNIDITRGSNMNVQNSRVDITRTSSTHTSVTKVGVPGGIRIPGTGVAIPGSSGVSNLGSNVGLPSLQNPVSNLGIPNLPGVQNPGSNQGLPNTGVGRPSGSFNTGSNMRADGTGSMTGNSQLPPTQNFEAGGSTKTINCPPGMTFRRCSPTCPVSCGTLNRSTCQKKCINACFCPDGMVIDNPKSPRPRCIHPSMCRGTGVAPPPVPGNTGVGGLLGGLGGLGGLLG